MEKQLATVAYWIGILSCVACLIMRFWAFVGASTVDMGKSHIGFRTFLEGAVLFFVMAAASAVVAMSKERKA